MAASSASGTGANQPITATPLLTRLPVSFEANQGQFDSQTSFVARGPGYAFRLGATDASLVLRKPLPDSAANDTSHRAHNPRDPRPHPKAFSVSNLRLSLIGADPHSIAAGQEQLPGTVNYFVGNDPKRWRAGIPTFASVKYENVYPGIALVYYGNQRQLEHDFVVAPGANPGRILVRLEGADDVVIGASGDLVANVAGSQIHWQKPRCYQCTATGTNEIEGAFVLKGENLIAFDIGAYDRTQTLIIDPILLYASFYGGSDFDEAWAVAVDSNGNAFITGETFSTDLVTTNAYDSTRSNPNDIFVAKFSSSGSNLVYATYLGGNSDDYSFGLAVDGSGNAYVTGNTISPNFPLKNAYQTIMNGIGDSFGTNRNAFVTKFGPAGTNLLYSTFFGGLNDVTANAIALGTSGTAFIAGQTYSHRSDGFPILNAFQSSPGGGNQPNDPSTYDAFVAKFDTTSSGAASLIYSSYLGGGDDEYGYGIAVDTSGNAYVVGQVEVQAPDCANPVLSPTFPTLNAFQPVFNNGVLDLCGATDAFLTKVNAAGSAMVFSTFLGGSEDEVAYAVAVDSAANVYVTGQTSSFDFPTANAMQPVLNNDPEDTFTPDAFVLKLASSGISLPYSTFFGGADVDAGFAIAVDSRGAIYFGGQSFSDDMPVTSGTVQPTNSSSSYAAFAAKLNPAVPGPSSLVFSTYIVGDPFEYDSVNGIAVDGNGNFVVAGSSDSTGGFPTTPGAFQTNSRGLGDAFVARFASPPDMSVAMFSSTNFVLVGGNLTYTLYVNNNGRQDFHNVVLTDSVPAQLQLLSVSTTLGNTVTNGNIVTANLGQLTNGAAALVTITAKTITPTSITNTASITSTETVGGSEPNTNNNVSRATTVIRGIADVTLTLSATPNPVLTTSNVTYRIGVTNKGPNVATTIFVSNALPTGVTVISSNTTLGSMSGYTNGIAWGVGNLSVGAGALMTLVVVAPSTGTTLTDTAQASAFELDNFPANNNGTSTVTVLPFPDLAVSMSDLPDPVRVASNLTYTITVNNLGVVTSTGLVLTDALPANTVFVSAQSAQFSCSQSGGFVTCTLSNLAAAATASVTIKVFPTLDGQVTNTAVLTSTMPDPVSGNNSSSITTTVLNNPMTTFLQIARAGTNVVLYWSTNATGYSLQKKPTFLGLPDWAAVTNVPKVVGTRFYVTNAPSATGAFYRLSKTRTPPRLSVFASPPFVVLSWPGDSADFTLQSTPVLQPPAWQPVPNVQPVLVGNNVYFTNTPSGTAVFFRLAD